jgi:hypothetical protein
MAATKKLTSIRLIDHHGMLKSGGRPMYEGGPRVIDDVAKMPKVYQRLAAKLIDLSKVAGAKSFDIALFTDTPSTVEQLLKYGESFPFGVLVKACRNSQCHKNSSVWALLDPASFSLASGYAGGIHEDGKMRWRQHSWILLNSPPFAEQVRDHVMEVTSPFGVYFGAVHTQEGTIGAARDELGPEISRKVVEELRPKALKIAQKYGNASKKGATLLQKLVSDFTFKNY